MTEIVDMTNAAELDAFVERHPRCHFMQTSLYGRFRTDRTWTGIICRDRDRNIRGTMALLRHTTTSIIPIRAFFTRRAARFLTTATSPRFESWQQRRGSLQSAAARICCAWIRP